MRTANVIPTIRGVDPYSLLLVRSAAVAFARSMKQRQNRREQEDALDAVHRAQASDGEDTVSQPPGPQKSGLSKHRTDDISSVCKLESKGEVGATVESADKDAEDDAPGAPTLAIAEDDAPGAPTLAIAEDIASVAPTLAIAEDIAAVAPTLAIAEDDAPVAPTLAIAENIAPVAPTLAIADTDVSHLELEMGVVYHGRYKVARFIAYGTTSSVWAARDLTCDSLLRVLCNQADNLCLRPDDDDDSPTTWRAIKVLDPDYLHSAELRILERLKTYDPTHPGYNFVLKLRDSFDIVQNNNKHVCLVVDIVGHSMHTRRIQAPEHVLPLRQTKRYFMQLLLALQYAHAAGVIHTGEWMLCGS